MIGKCNVNNSASFAIIGIKYDPTDSALCVLNSTQQLIKSQGSNGRMFFNCPKAGVYTVFINNQIGYSRSKAFIISNKGQVEFQDFVDNLWILEQDIINEGDFCRLSYSTGDRLYWRNKERYLARTSNEPAILLGGWQKTQGASISLISTFQVSSNMSMSGQNFASWLTYTDKNIAYYSHYTRAFESTGSMHIAVSGKDILLIDDQQDYLSVDETTGEIKGTKIDKLNEWINRMHHIVERDS